LGGSKPARASRQWEFFFNLAVTQDMILGAQSHRKRFAKCFRAARHASAAGPRRRAAISGAPAPNSRKNLIGLGYFDFQRVDWQATKGSLD